MTKSTARRAVRAARWRLRKTQAALAVRLAPDAFAPQLAAARIPIDAEVAIYFAETPDRVYQLDQWLPVLEQLSRTHRVVVILRELRTMRDVQDRTTLPVVCVTTFLDLMNLYDAGEFKVGIYVNNGFRNFQSLNNPRMLHVHVNHGESDKLSSFSNQVKAYDRVFVAGQVAVERYREALIDFDDSKVVTVGPTRSSTSSSPPELPASTRRTVMYAPTWEGESESNNWTSAGPLRGPDRRGAARAAGRAGGVQAAPEGPRLDRSGRRPRAPQDRGRDRCGEPARPAGRPRGPDGRRHPRDVRSLPTRWSETCPASRWTSSTCAPDAPLFLTDRRDDRDLLAETPR